MGAGKLQMFKGPSGPFSVTLSFWRIIMVDHTNPDTWPVVRELIKAYRRRIDMLAWISWNEHREAIEQLESSVARMEALDPDEKVCPF